MEAAKLERQYHPMITPEIPSRENRMFTLGRNVAKDRPDTEMILCQSDFVSRQHCDVYYKNGAYWIKDLKSLNGTFLNGQRLLPVTERELRFGDILGLGVSHDTVEVNPADREYFIFKFVKHQYELISLDDEDDPAVVDVGNNFPKSVSADRKDIEECQDSDEDIIEIIDENLDSCSVSAPKSVVKPLPPPPPPPIISKPSASSNSKNSCPPPPSEHGTEVASHSKSSSSRHQLPASKDVNKPSDRQPVSHQAPVYQVPDEQVVVRLGGVPKVTYVKLSESAKSSSGGSDSKLHTPNHQKSRRESPLNSPIPLPRISSVPSGVTETKSEASKSNTNKHSSHITSENKNPQVQVAKKLEEAVSHPHKDSKNGSNNVPAVKNNVDKKSSSGISSGGLKSNESKPGPASSKVNKPENKEVVSPYVSGSQNTSPHSKSNAEYSVPSTSKTTPGKLSPGGSRSKDCPKKNKVKGMLATSSDDSSDGVSDRVSIKNFVQNVELSPERQNKESKKVGSPLKPKSVDSPKPSLPIEVSAIKTEPVVSVMEDINRRKPVVKLKQLIISNKETGEFSMKKSKINKISPSNREKIALQFEESLSKNLKRKPESEHNFVEDSDSHSSDLMTPIVVQRKKKRKIDHQTDKKLSPAKNQSPTPARKHFKRLTRDSDSSKSDEPSKKRTKKSSESNNTSKPSKPESPAKNHKSTPKKEKSPKEENNRSRDENKNKEPLAGTSRSFNDQQTHSTSHQRASSPVSPGSPASDLSYYSDVSDGEFESPAKSIIKATPIINTEPHLEPALNPDEYRQGVTGRKMMFIDNAPAPPSVQKQQQRNFAMKSKREQEQINRRNANINNINNINNLGSPKPDVGVAKISMKEKLEAIARKKSVEDKEPKVVTPKKNAPVRAYRQTRNRNDDLVETMLANEQIQKELEKSIHPTKPEEILPPPQSLPNKPIAAPRRELTIRRDILPPLPSTEAQAKMPVNLITADMNRFKTQNVAPSRQSVASVAPYKKVVEDPRENAGGSKVYDYRHNHNLPVQTKVVDPRGVSRPLRQGDDILVPKISVDEAHKAILRWRPAWLAEQKAHYKPPPLTSRDAVQTHIEYPDFKSYIETFFPLLLLEIWATITQEEVKGERDNEMPEFPIAIDYNSKTEECPMLAKSKSKSTPKDDAYWTLIQCHVLTKHTREMSMKKDLAIITLGVITEDKHQNKIHIEKDYFGFILHQTEKVYALSDIAVGYINPELHKKNPEALYKNMMTVVIHLSSVDKLDVKAKLGKIKRVAYISPKLREFKALNSLQYSKLYDRIVYPKAPRVQWNVQHDPKPNQLTHHASKLNPAQKSVIAYVSERVRANEPELLLLHGPPGTGKTRTIIGMILQILLSKDQHQQGGFRPKILVCTPSNTALDEIMIRLEEAKKDIPRPTDIQMVRVGECEDSNMKSYSLDNLVRKNEEKNSVTITIRNSIKQCQKEMDEKKAEIDALVKFNGSRTTIESLRRELREIEARRDGYKMDFNKRNVDRSPSQSQKMNILEQCNVICSTLNSCSNSLLSQTFGRHSKNSATKMFSCCIVDEASQTTEPETLAPLLLQVDKLILVGDPQQLGATVLSQEAKQKMYDRSLFGRHYHYFTRIAKSPNSVMMLTQQYRMHPEILSWPNDYFYKSLLKTRCIGRSEDDACPLKPYLFLNLGSKESSNNEGQISNEEEVKMVVEIIRNVQEVVHATSKHQKKWSIGVITPYNTQKHMIMRSLRKELPNVYDAVKVDTVDSFQGKERDIIIISCVRTDDTGFLKNPQRLNVALTRARHSLLIVGNADLLKTDSMWKCLIDNAKDRKCQYDIPKTNWSNVGFLRKRLFVALSPTKSQIPDEERRREFL